MQVRKFLKNSFYRTKKTPPIIDKQTNKINKYIKQAKPSWSERERPETLYK